MVNSIKIMALIQELSVNCFPSCSDPKIQQSLLAMSPCIDIVRLKTSLPLQTNDGQSSKSNSFELNKLLNFAKDLVSKDDEGKETAKEGQVTLGQNIGGLSMDYTATKSDNINFLDNFYGFFSMMSADADRYCNNVPIISSPQIKVNTSNGWKNEQSLLSFVKNISNSGAIGGLLQAINLSSVVNGVIDEVERIGGMAGWSPRIGPYFSLTDNPFGDRPSLNVEIKLINDTETAAMDNSMFLDQMLRNSLIGTTRAHRGGGDGIENFGSVDGSSLFNSWRPPKLFNVGLKFGAGGAQDGGKTIYVKRYYLCTLEATVQPEGLFRSAKFAGRIPDAYSVQMNFTSLMPDTLDLWSGYGFSYSLDSGEKLKQYAQDQVNDELKRIHRQQHLEASFGIALKKHDRTQIDAIIAEYDRNGWSYPVNVKTYLASQNLAIFSGVGKK